MLHSESVFPSTADAGPLAQRNPAKLPWAIVLAGGDGSRLRSFTQTLAGDDRPKQFCKVFGDETLLAQTVRRVRRLVARERTIVAATRKHLPDFAADINAVGETVIVQPENRGTGPAILASLLAIHQREPHAHVALFPSDHYFANDTAFVDHVGEALVAVQESPKCAVLLGIVPNRPEVDYGWIQPGKPVLTASNPALRQVELFWEKPGPSVAEKLFAQGCLWNSFVAAGSVRSLLSMICSAAPWMWAAFQVALEGTKNEDALKRLYAGLPVIDFSKQILVRCPQLLHVLPVADVGWVDIGRPERVHELLARHA